MKKKSMIRGTKYLWLCAVILALLAVSACEGAGAGGPVPVITISTQPAPETSVTEGAITESLSVTATVTENAVLSYQWYSNTAANNTAGTKVDGAAMASFAIPTTLTAGTYYYFCELTAPGAAPVRSAAATVTVVKAAVPAINITTQPQANMEAAEGFISESLSVTAVGIGGAEINGYQWYSNTSASNEGGTAIDGAVTANFAIPTALTVGTYYYFCEITATGAAPLRSNAATLTVFKPVPAINIITQPAANTKATVGHIRGSLTVTASGIYGAEVTGYQWYSNTTASNEGGTKIEGAATETYTFPTSTTGTYYYYCEIKATGVDAPVYSSVAKVTVGNLEIVITPIADPVLVGETAEVTAGTNKDFSVSGSGWTEWQWYINGVPETGAESASYTFNQPAGVYTLTVVVTDDAGNKYSGSCWVTVE